MPNKIYRIQLSPIDHYFFGGEKTFGIDVNTNYLARSRFYPQQTTLLGLIRQELLYANGLLNPSDKSEKISNTNEATTVIGAQSFAVGYAAKSFGSINGLSPLFLEKQGQAYLPAPFDKNYQWETDSLASLSSTLQPKSFVPHLKGYNPKEGITKNWMSKTGTDSEAEETLFKSKGQVGILKKSGKEKDEEGFYKQFYLKLDKDFCFSFYLNLEEIAGVQHLPSEKIVTMGKEQSAFVMRVQELEGEAAPTLAIANMSAAAPSNIHKIILLSDAFVDREIYRYCDYSVTETISFRYLETSIAKTEHYYNLSSPQESGQSDAAYQTYKQKRMGRSRKYNLLQRGSVLYVNDLPKVENLLKNKHPEFNLIGYNHYQII